MNGIWFDNIHSYENLNLILSQVNIPPAVPKTNFIDIPGGDGSVDLTEALGEVKFENRADASFTFTVLPEDDFEVKKRQVSNLVNGRRFNRIIVDKDPDYFWTGRCIVNEYASDKNLHKIVVMAVLAPYKLRTGLTEMILPAGESISGTLPNGRKTTVPTITNTKEVTIVYNGNTFTLNPGTHVEPDIELQFGDNPITVTSEASVKFVYREGDL